MKKSLLPPRVLNQLISWKSLQMWCGFEMWLFGQWTVLKFYFKNKEVLLFLNWNNSILFSLIKILLDSLATTILISAPDSSKVQSLFIQFSSCLMLKQKHSWMMDIYAVVDCYLQRNDTNKVFRLSSIASESKQSDLVWISWCLYFCFSDSFSVSEVEEIAFFVGFSQIS